MPTTATSTLDHLRPLWFGKITSASNWMHSGSDFAGIFLRAVKVHGIVTVPTAIAGCESLLRTRDIDPAFVDMPIAADFVSTYDSTIAFLRDWENAYSTKSGCKATDRDRNVWYVGKGYAFDKDLNPVMICTWDVKATRLAGHVNSFCKWNPTVRFSPAVLTDNRYKLWKRLFNDNIGKWPGSKSCLIGDSRGMQVPISISFEDLTPFTRRMREGFCSDVVVMTNSVNTALKKGLKHINHVMQ